MGCGKRKALETFGKLKKNPADGLGGGKGGHILGRRERE